MTVGEFFWLDDAKFAQSLLTLNNDQLMFVDKHNVRKRKGGKLGAWVGVLQAPWTLGISFIGTGIAARNRVVAKRRLEMIHAELLRRGLGKHADDWKDAAFASLAVGAGAVVGMGFAPGAEIAAQNFAEHGAMTAAQYASGVATSQVAQSLGLVATETASAHYTDPDTWVHPHGRCVGVTNTGTPIFETPVLYNQPAPQYSAYGMNTNAMGGRYPVQPQWQPQMQAFPHGGYPQHFPQDSYPQQFPQQQYPQYGKC